MARQFPMGWWEVPGKGPNDGPGHACPICVVNPDHFEDMLERREAAMHMVVDLHPPTDDATPFEGVDEAEDRTGETAPTDPSDDRSGPAVPSAER